MTHSLPCQSALIHSFARTCIRVHKGVRTRTPNARARREGRCACAGCLAGWLAAAAAGGGEGGEGGVRDASNQSASGPLILHWRAGGTTAPGHSGTDSHRGEETGSRRCSWIRQGDGNTARGGGGEREEEKRGRKQTLCPANQRIVPLPD